MYRTISEEVIDDSKVSSSEVIIAYFTGAVIPKTRRLVRTYEKSTFVPNAVLDNMRHISATAFKVYMYLIRHDWFEAKNYQGCFLKMKTLARECGYSKSTVSRALRELRTFGWIEYEPAGTKQLQNGEAVDVDCYEYWFSYPVDEDGREIVCPTKSEATLYRKHKNIGDKRTAEEKNFRPVNKRRMKSELSEELQH